MSLKVLQMIDPNFALQESNPPPSFIFVILLKKHQFFNLEVLLACDENRDYIWKLMINMDVSSKHT